MTKRDWEEHQPRKTKQVKRNTLNIIIFDENVDEKSHSANFLKPISDV